MTSAPCVLSCFPSFCFNNVIVCCSTAGSGSASKILRTVNAEPCFLRSYSHISSCPFHYSQKWRGKSPRTPAPNDRLEHIMVLTTIGSTIIKFLRQSSTPNLPQRWKISGKQVGKKREIPGINTLINYIFPVITMCFALLQFFPYQR